MSNNLVSQQLPVPTRQIGQFEPLPSELDSSVYRMPTEMMIPVSNNFVPQQLAALGQQIGSVGSMGNNLGSQNIAVSKQMGQTVTKEGDMGRQQFSSSNQQYGQVVVSMNNTGPEQLLLPGKRKADVEPIYTNSMSLQTSIANKRAAQMEHSPKSTGLSQLSAANKKIVQVQPISVSTGSQNLHASNKKMVRNESSVSNKAGSQRVQTSKGRSTQMEPSPKIHAELSEAVRSKMRESLAAALALVAQNQDKGTNEKQHSPDEAASSPKWKRADSFKPADSISMASDVSKKVHENSADMPLKESSGAEKPSDTQSRSADAPTGDSFHKSAQTFNYDAPVFHCSDILPNEDVPFSDNFFVKDELLQGNGLSWAFDLDMQMTEAKVRGGEKPNPGHDAFGQDGGEQVSNSPKDVDIKDESEMVHSPEDLAFKIETELFKLFGGVNKKYKEKGRSLLFNLKDRNNPELIERVMSGEISPERLCSMTAEELASKELSQWRMAKAEELAQMVVLPDTDVDIRRVKKTHKGEYQVEVEKDDGYEAEVSVVSSLTHNRPKKESAARPSSEADDAKDRENVMGDKDKSDNQNPSYRLTIPNDGMDLMQGIMVDDMKDAEFLPPIVSLDEFMESLNSEPPFENLPVGTEQSSPSDKGKSGSGKETVVSSPAKDPSDIAMSKTDKVDGDNTEPQSNAKYIQSPVKQKTSIAIGASMSDQVWQGAVQLNISSLVTVVGLYKSGEKTSTKEWPSSLEIKGRVRLDAFEKFLQELPMSRSRAVMVVHFIMEEESSESDRASLCEVVDSFVLEDRLGFAEPAPGVELYLCPPHPKILDLLSMHLPKDQTQTLNSTHNGLIGIVVWRRIHVSSSAMSPNSSSHHKHCSKKQNFTSRRQLDKDNINVNPNLSSKLPGISCPPASSQPPTDDEDDDIPPGFGPAASSREDDLPEFNFSGNVNSSAARLNAPRGSRMNPSQPTLQGSSRDQVRELIHKYGQIGNNASPRNWQDVRGVGLQIEPWNDDDDDIPEWQGPQQHLKPQPTVRGFQQPPVRQQMLPIGTPLRHLTNMIEGPQTIPPRQSSAGRAQPPASKSTQPSSLVAGQYYGAPMPTNVNWRQDARRNRGF